MFETGGIIVRIVAGTALMVSAIIHLLHPYAFAFTLASYQCFPTASLTVLPLVTAGVTFAVGILLFFDRSRAVVWIAAMLFLGFVLVQGQALARGLEIDCGCFGFRSHEIGWMTILLPAVAGLACVFVASSKSYASVPVMWTRLGSTVANSKLYQPVRAPAHQRRVKSAL